MKKILIFGGTSEGRILSQKFSECKIPCDICVATEYGKEVLSQNDYINIIAGRLSQTEMLNLYEKNLYSAVIDATHPYACEVSSNIKESLKNFNSQAGVGKLKLFRLERKVKSAVDNEDIIYFEKAEDCAAELTEKIKNTDKNVFLATGTKELPLFCRDENLKKRIIARVIPSLESLEICRKEGLEGRQIIAMQGPFSFRMNLAQLEDNNAAFLVTKESGAAGGFDEKIEAALQAGAKCFVIKRPENIVKEAENTDDCEVFSDMDSLIMRIHELLHILPKKKHSVILAGIGMGSLDGLTVEVQKAVQSADYLFGAERILSTAKKIKAAAQSYNYYLAKDIVPVLQKIISERAHSSSVILFSGDTGFYSGAEKLLSELKKLPEISLKVYPGISSMQYLFSRAGLSWQNTSVLNLHGVQKDEWVDKLSKIVYKNKQIFFISSSFSDIQELGSELSRISDFGKVNLKIILGYQLSYPEEKIRTMSPAELQTVFRPGLYSGIILIEQA